MQIMEGLFYKHICIHIDMCISQSYVYVNVLPGVLKVEWPSSQTTDSSLTFSLLPHTQKTAELASRVNNFIISFDVRNKDFSSRRQRWSKKGAWRLTSQDWEALAESADGPGRLLGRAWWMSWRDQEKRHPTPMVHWTGKGKLNIICLLLDTLNLYRHNDVL